MEGAAQTILSNVGQLLGQEFRQLSGVGGKVAELRDELAILNAILRMQSEAEDGAVDHFDREWMKQLRELAYDAEDCVDLYLFRIRSRPGDGLLVWSKRLLVTLFSRRRLASDIAALSARAVVISERHARYGVGCEAVRRPASSAPVLLQLPCLGWIAAAHEELPLAKHTNLQLVGVREQADELANKLKVLAGENDKKIKEFFIVGFGGLGKTTLAMEVCRQLESEFQRQAQVSVSQAFDGRNGLKGLLLRILQQIVIVKPKADDDEGIEEDDEGIKEEDSVAHIDSTNVDQLAQMLKNHLQNKRYLIVIDDVRTIAAWNAIRSKLPNNNCGSRIIVTTRINSVTNLSSCGASDNIYLIKRLNKANSKELFLSRAFGSMSVSCPEGLENIMDKVLKKCGGIPLAIISIAGLLASYKSADSNYMWETVFKSIGSHMESHPILEGMRQIVTFSYDHLSHHLKGCMMYLSIFPEDYVIVKERLLMRWIAEGLVAERRGLTLMEVAESYFNELVSRSMIERASDIVSYYDGRVETCRVHDMMLEVMVSKSLEANFVSLIGGQYQGICYDRIRRLSVHGGVEAAKKSQSKKMAEGHGRKNDIKGVNVQHVRSLSMFELGKHELLDRLGEFTLLRVLDLEDCKGLGNEHMRYICRMYLLRFLSLKSTDVSELPPEVGKLEHLQTLDASLTYLEDLPETVTDLEELEILLFSNRRESLIRWMPPPGLKKMKSLRKANKVVIRSNVKVAQEIGELEQLQDLAIYVDSTSAIHHEAHQELIRSMRKLYSLRCLNIGDMGWDRKTMNFLHDLTSPPPLLRDLRICGGLVGGGLPGWVGLLPNLVEFTIGWAYLRSEPLFDVLCKLRNLKRLTLETNFYEGLKLVAHTTKSLPELTDLAVGNCYGHLNVVEFEQGSMPKLETLKVQFAGDERKIIGINHLTNLKGVHFAGKKGNKAMQHELYKLKEENETRKRNGSHQLTIKMTYE